MEVNEHIERIRRYDSHEALKSLWAGVKNGLDTGWPSGLAFEYLILRAFELEGGIVTWPYSVRIDGVELEQIDGLIFVPSLNLYVIVESKDWSKKIPFGPIAKLRNALQRRPGNLIGAIFSSSDFTEPALVLAGFLAKDTILLWNQHDIDHCLENSYFTTGLRKKYEWAITHGISTKDLSEVTEI